MRHFHCMGFQCEIDTPYILLHAMYTYAVRGLDGGHQRENSEILYCIARLLFLPLSDMELSMSSSATSFWEQGRDLFCPSFRVVGPSNDTTKHARDHYLWKSKARSSSRKTDVSIKSWRMGHFLYRDLYGVSKTEGTNRPNRHIIYMRVVHGHVYFVI